MKDLTLVFVHGWSVTNVQTYGELPIRLREEAAAQNIGLKVKDIYLGKYISFHDEVRLEDISRAFMAAVTDQGLDKEKIICITHSTGGPVIRDWWHRYYPKKNDKCPLTHLIMLAPANFGSSLAQLGKAKIGRLKSWFQGVEPGQGVLDWLELGSVEAWRLNLNWILRDSAKIKSQGFFPFVITGQSIDRKLYDNLNSYTGELGSDGVVRVAAANLEGCYIKLKQQVPVKVKAEISAGRLEIIQNRKAQPTPLRIIPNKSHSGNEMGILNSVTARVGKDKSEETVQAILSCIRVKNISDYDALYKRFKLETALVQKNEILEHEDRLLLSDRYFIHDRFSMLIFKVTDTEGHPVKDYDLLLTVGKNNDPNLLPHGFFVDRQQNKKNPEMITYFINYNIMNGAPAVTNNVGQVIRPVCKGIDTLGLIIHPRPTEGFVHYLPCHINASRNLFEKAITPNSTTLIEIVLQRVVYKEIFQADKLVGKKMPSKRDGDFKKVKPGTVIK